jgi:agmatine deiminase
MKTINSTPRKDGFRLPAEFEPHAGCWMLWPERPDGWTFGAKPAQRAYTAVASAIGRFEPVTVGVSAQQFLNARQLLPDYVRVVELSANDAWARDCAPLFVVNAQGLVRGVDWEFNGWGGSYYNSSHLDNLVPRKILELERLDRYKADMVLEGGSIHVDGQGTLITTESCLLNPNRNPHLAQEEIEAQLKEYLNVDKIIWLSRGVYLDNTAGHVDNLCCFIRPGVVALTWTDDTLDPQHEISLEVYEQLKAATDARGRKLEIHKIHQPDPLYVTQEEVENLDIIETTKPRRAGDRLTASYLNFYIANGGIIAPLFNDRVHDWAALETLQKLFPNREVIGIQSRDINFGGGNIHCITMQQPTGQRPLYQ